MKLTVYAALTGWMAIALLSCESQRRKEEVMSSPQTLTLWDASAMKEAVVRPVVKSEEDWREALTPEQYRILRRGGTERAFQGKYHDHKEEGLYRCAGCGTDLFDSKTKFPSGTGWPSFWAPVSEKNVATESDRSFGMIRTEVRCARCGGHLGHVFEDGPEPTGLRYCINSAALDFQMKEETDG